MASSKTRSGREVGRPADPRAAEIARKLVRSKANTPDIFSEALFQLKQADAAAAKRGGK
jgi:hypothetical protein